MFATVQDQRTPVSTNPVQPPADERRSIAWVGKSVIFKGELISSEDMIIDGRVEGTIEVHDHALTIGPAAQIQADIAARSVTIRGSVTGTITAANLVEIRETGSVEGDITSPHVSVAEGAVVHGRIDTLTKRADGSGKK
jgi:cytoskeletal protein CcmA (bactofilin family)